MKWGQLDINYNCNNRCIFCYAGDLEDCAPPKSFEEVEKTFDSIIKKAEGVRILGGEVTLRPDFFRVISLAKNKGFEMVEIISKGRYFAKPGFAQKAVKAGMTGIIISVHGHTAKIHDFLTGTPGSFDETIKGIKELIKLYQGGNLPKLNVNLVITRNNYRYLPAMAKFFIELGVPSIIFSSLKILGRGFKNKDKLVISYTEMLPRLKKMIKQVDNLKLENGNFHFEIENIPFCVLPKEHWPYLANLYGFSDVQYFPRLGYELRVPKKIGQKRKLSAKIKGQCRGCVYLDACPIFDCVSGDFFDYLNDITSVNYHQLNQDYYDIYGTKEFKAIKKSDAQN